MQNVKILKIRFSRIVEDFKLNVFFYKKLDEKWKISTIESLYILILHKFQNCKFLEIWGSSCAPIIIKKSVVVRRNAHESYEKQVSKKGLN